MSTDEVGGPAEKRSGDRTRGCLLASIVIVGALLCACCSTTFLVLTGIIAEPETVIEQIVRTIAGG